MKGITMDLNILNLTASKTESGDYEIQIEGVDSADFPRGVPCSWFVGDDETNVTTTGPFLLVVPPGTTETVVKARIKVTKGVSLSPALEALGYTGDRLTGVTSLVRSQAQVFLTGEWSAPLAPTRAARIVETSGSPGTIRAKVTNTRTSPPATVDIALYAIIKKSCENLGYTNYKKHIDLVLRCPESTGESSRRDSEKADRATYNIAKRRSLPFTDTDAYRSLKVATEAFMITNAATAVVSLESLSDPDLRDYLDRMLQESLSVHGSADQALDAFATHYLVKRNGGGPLMLPYLATVADSFPGSPMGDNAQDWIQDYKVKEGAKKIDECCAAWLECKSEKLRSPMLIELIWSYWHEEMALVQTMNAIMLRFQNVQGSRSGAALANIEIDPLRPINNLLWGFIQDEQHRLTIQRRAYEYVHHYGLPLIGRAVPNLKPAESRSRFWESFVNLLRLCHAFYRQSDDTTIVPDGFPLLNVLREVHLLLAEGAHNQFRDLPVTSRIEMLMKQFVLARDEFREFLPRRVMVDYPEPWMHSVATMRRLQGWGDSNILHFWHLAKFAEPILLSIRWGNWVESHKPQPGGQLGAYLQSRSADLHPGHSHPDGRRCDLGQCRPYPARGAVDAPCASRCGIAETSYIHESCITRGRKFSTEQLVPFGHH
jgi:hypothetical protein